MKNRLPLLIITAFVPMVWGSTYLITSEFLPPNRPFTAALIRVLPAGLLLLLITREFPRKKELSRTCFLGYIDPLSRLKLTCVITREFPRKNELVRIILLGILNIGLFQAMLFVSAYRLPGGLAAILSSTQTIFVLVLTRTVAKKATPASAWLAALMGIIGIILLVASPSTTFDVIGILAALTGAVAMACGIFFTSMGTSSLSTLAMTGWQLLVGGIFLLPITLLTEEPLPPLTPANIGGYAFLCLVGTALAYCVYFHGLSKLPPAVIASLGPLSPVTAFILGWIFLGQDMTPLSMLGFVLVLASIVGVQRAMMGARKATLSHTK